MKLSLGNLNPGVCPSHPINIYTCRVTTAPRVCSGGKKMFSALNPSIMIALNTSKMTKFPLKYFKLTKIPYGTSRMTKMPLGVSQFGASWTMHCDFLKI